MSRKIIALTIVILTVVGLTPGGFSAPQTLTKCKVQSKPLTIPRTQKPFPVTGTVLSNSRIEYHLKPTSDLNADVQLTANDPVKLDIYLVNPPTVIKKSVNKWSGTFSAKQEYVLTVNNCFGKTTARFHLEIKPH